MKEDKITGIHHVTAIASDPQKNLDFYAGILGLRLVKKTVNFDAPDVYHFYYGNETGEPGTILTFFPFGDIQRGRSGKGMINTIAFSVPISSMDYWEERLRKFSVDYHPAQERFGSEAVISFKDTDGLALELVFTDKDARNGFTYGHIPQEHSIKGFYNIEIWEEGYERTAGLLTGHLGHELIMEKGNRFRFAADDSPGNYVDILCSPDSLRGIGGNGTVHHMAFCTPDKESQLELRNLLIERMLNPTPVIDRQYFESVYFREPGGVLFEIATRPPGFTVDESKEHLGEGFMLPGQYEPRRREIEKITKPVRLNLEKFRRVFA
ncbi:MAG: ring-cleaving dioxygenase [Ignavibacteria bacterium]|jgi:glyoxalase family protein|nr:ring-cleaving dioxygenase [Ignavibacteria bacterium]MCU7501506.1 ring-cleaving dioxygenase [Ignavibacteria bacterium]MCU7515978.1 ring-cleaving dioxygenase [Ignavibacteria bacterium]